MVCLVIVCGSSALGADVDAFVPEDLLHPQGLKHTGIYALRQIDPDLTGAGVKFGVICRSMTYIDNEPQNDYHPDIRHNCFKNSGFTPEQLDERLYGISPHSTAICSILFGEDPNAFHPEIGSFYYEGATPRAQGEIHELWNFVLNHVYTQEPPDADILTASFGIEFEYPWTRGIELLAESYGTIVVASIGNGTDSHNPVLYPAAGANVIGVGVVDIVEHVEVAGVVERGVVDPVDAAGVVVRVEPLRPVAKGDAEPDGVARRVAQLVRTRIEAETPGLETGAVSPVPAVVERPRVFGHARSRGVDEVVSIVSAELSLFSLILSRISLRRLMRPVMPVLSSSWISDTPDLLALTISPKPTSS